MNQFRTTSGIFNTTLGKEIYFNDNWMDSDIIITPPKTNWSYSRELTIEDIDLWEIIWESSFAGVYAAWSPYAEFYLITTPFEEQPIEVYYGSGAQEKVQKKLNELGAGVATYSIWVEPEDMWLYSNQKINI